MTVDEVRSLLEAEIEASGSRGAWASANKVSPAYVSDVLKKHRDPGDKILQALGLEKVVTYHRKKDPHHG